VALIKPRRDRRALGYAALAIGFTALALLRGEPRDLALAAPFAAVLIVGLRSIHPIEVAGRISFDTGTSFEEDEVSGTIEVVRPRGTITTIAVDNRAGWTAVDPDPVLIWTVGPAGDKITAPFTVRAETWGRHRLGALTMSLRRPLGVTVWELVHDDSPSFNVLPSPEHLRRLLPAPASQSTAGVHISRFVADGFDFAELRPFAIGDRLRDVNWRASARSDQLQTNRRHPDRSGEIVLLLDTFADGIGTASTTAQAALTRAARAAWSLAQLHLDVQDRVGLAAQGRVVTQLRPRSGDRARYDLLGTLLSIGGLVAAGESAHGRQPLSRLPPNALILALTPLIDQRFTVDLLALHRAGRPVMAVQMVLDDLYPPAVDSPDVLARRIFALGIEQRRDDLVRAGVPLAQWTEEADLGGIVGGLDRLHRRVRVAP
jgi:uncharacterized protein (DUF58 family)